MGGRALHKKPLAFNHHDCPRQAGTPAATHPLGIRAERGGIADMYNACWHNSRCVRIQVRAKLVRGLGVSLLVPLAQILQTLRAQARQGAQPRRACAGGTPTFFWSRSGGHLANSRAATSALVSSSSR